MDSDRFPAPWQKKQPVIDTLIGFADVPARVYASIRKSLKDRDSLEQLAEMPAGYMFHEVPALAEIDEKDPVAVTLEQMDLFGIRTGLISVTANPEVAEKALSDFPARFVASWTIDPNDGVAGTEALARAHQQWGIRAASFYPHGTSPQVAIDAPLAYVYYAKCVELGIPVFVTVGIAGPRVPSWVQHVERLDQVMYDFPDLVVVMRHGAEPWEALAVKLMLKWPNLYYSTSGFAPKYYPKAIIDYANSRGGDKVLYAGYFPMGLSLVKIFAQLRDVPFRAHVWPKFLHDNAARLLRLEG